MKIFTQVTNQTYFVLLFFCISSVTTSHSQCLPSLGASSNFVLFTTAGAMGNTGTSIIDGNIGTNVGDVTGFGAPSVINGTTHIGNSTTVQATIDLTTAYNTLFALTPTVTDHAPAFGSETVTSGIYSIGGAGSIAGVLTLDGQGDMNAVFVFKFGGAFTTGAVSTVVLINGAQASNVFWLANGAASMAATTTMSGTVIANGAISMGDGCVLYGRLLSTTGAIAVYNLVTDSTGIENLDAVGGTVSTNQTICLGSSPSDVTLTGSTGSIVAWEKATDAAFTTPIPIVSTSTTLLGSVIGNLYTDTYIRASLASNNCTAAYSTSIKISMGNTTTWNGIIWDDGAPVLTSSAIISEDYDGTDDLTACSLLVTNNAVVSIPSGTTVTLYSHLTVASGSTFTLNNNANLIQNGTTNTNTGSITVIQTSSALFLLDYTLWSSCVANQNLHAFSPTTQPNRFYQYNTLDDQFESVAPIENDFETGKGYLIRLPNDHPLVATNWDGEFNGVPNNGDYVYTMTTGDATQRYNLVGNPYPSPIDATKFVTDNRILGNESIKGTLYFWRKTNNALSPSFCSWSKAGGDTGTFVSNGENEVNDLNGIIQTGQGFFVEAEAMATEVKFTNSMRIGDTAGQFFRTTPSTTENHRLWLNLTTSTGAFSQTAIGYMTNATNGMDTEIDSNYMNDSATELYSVVADQKLVIQGRALPFDTSDVVPLGFKAATAGTYSIALDHFDGLFANNQSIYLRDTTTGTQHDLKLGAYTFVSSAGRFNDRFEVVYTNQLGVTPITFNANTVLIYKNNANLMVNSNDIVMTSVTVYDIQGRKVLEQQNINATQTSIQNTVAHQVLLVKITSIDGAIITKKIVW